MTGYKAGGVSKRIGFQIRTFKPKKHNRDLSWLAVEKTFTHAHTEQIIGIIYPAHVPFRTSRTTFMLCANFKPDLWPAGDLRNLYLHKTIYRTKRLFKSINHPGFHDCWWHSHQNFFVSNLGNKLNILHNIIWAYDKAVPFLSNYTNT